MLYPLSYEGGPGRVTAFVAEALILDDTGNCMWFDLANGGCRGASGGVADPVSSWMTDAIATQSSLDGERR